MPVKFFALLFFIVFSNVLYSQSCYFFKDDPIGLDTSYAPSVNGIVCQIDSLLNTGSQFKAFDYSTYLHLISTFDGSDKGLALMHTKSSTESLYFINIVKICSKSPTVKEFYIDIKLPNSGVYSCLDESKVILIEQLVKARMDAELSPDSDRFGASIKAGLLELERIIKLVNIGECCPSDPEAIRQIMLQRGFKPFECTIEGPPTLKNHDGKESGAGDIEDHANIEIEFHAQTMTASAHLGSDINKLIGLGQVAKGYITINENFCDNVFYNVISAFNSDNTDYDIHWHIWKNPDPNGMDLLFEKMTDYRKFIGKTIVERLNDQYQPADDCHGTNRVGRSGSTEVGGTIESWIIQLDYLAYNTDAEAEYAIPKSGKNGAQGYADLVDPTTLEIFEVKAATELAAASAQVSRYVYAANLACPRPPKVWVPGENYPSFQRILPNPRDPTKVLIPYLAAPGVVVYEASNSDAPPAPVLLPITTWERIRKFMERLGRDPIEIDYQIGEFLRENPDIAVALRSAALTAGVVIIIGTIVEDIVTAGAGIVDDWASFMVAYRLVAIATL